MTRTTKLYDPGPWPSVGLHEKTPLAGSIVAPAGAPSRLKIKVLDGRSGSLAVIVMVRRVPSTKIRSPTGSSTGGRFASSTTTVTGFSSERLWLPLSVTRTVNVYFAGPWVSVGVQRNSPVFRSIVAP